MLRRLILPLALLAGACGRADSAGTPDADAVWKRKSSPGAEDEVARRRAAAFAEAERLGPSHAWAGAYYYGDGLGTNVRLWLAPAAGFAFEWHGCLGVFDRNWGSVSETDGRVALEFALPNVREEFEGLDPVFVPVPWAERRYLVPPQRMKDFCNAVNSGWEPRPTAWGLFLLRSHDEERPVEGRPQVPAAFAQLLLDRPLRGRILEVLGGERAGPDAWRTRVRLDVGSRRGAWEGMELHVVEPWRGVDVEVVEAGADSSIALVESSEDDRPEVGWVLSSRPSLADR